MRHKFPKLIVALSVIVILLSLESGQVPQVLSITDPAEAAAPPRQQGGNQTSGPELDAADVVNLFWHEAVQGQKTLTKKRIRRSELGLSGAEAQDPKEVALAFMRTQRSALSLAASNRIDWRVTRVQPEKNGVAHVALQQLYDELPVLAGQVIVHTKDTVGVTAANGEYPPAITVSTKPTLSVEAAYKAARHELSLKDAILIEQKLLIFNPALLEMGASANHLAYRFVAGQLDGPERRVIFVDAHTGKLLFDYNDLHEGLNREIFDLNNSTTFPGSQCYEEIGPIAGGSPSTDCINAYTFTEDTYNYFLHTHRRDSFDNRGGTMRVSVNFGTTANAFWNGSQTAFGPGFATKDVTAHEWTHAVTQHTANLVYAYQSGALNESISDIFGTMVDRDDWLMGEDTPIGTMRSLENPNLFDDPKSVNDPDFYCGSFDNGGVHINSGVPNYTAYLISEGGRLNDIDVAGVGREKTEAVFYRALTGYLTSGGNFADAANALTGACSDLFGGASATCASVSNAVQATQLAAPVCVINSTPDSFEPDNAYTQATPIAADGTPQHHNFHTHGDYDWVSFSAVAGTDYVIETANLGPQNDTVLHLYDPDGHTQLAVDDDGGEGVASRIAWTASVNGVYYIRVRHYSVATAGDGTDYDLTVTGESGLIGQDTFENDDSPALANPITPDGEAQSHNFHDAGDVDWVSFAPIPGVSYVIETLNLGSDNDTKLELYDGDAATLLVDDDDGGAAVASRIEWLAPAEGVYFIKIFHYSPENFGPNTAYDLKVTTDGVIPDDFEPDDTASRAGDIAVNGGTQTHNFHRAGDEDWVQFTATSDSGYVIETSNLGNLGDTTLALYDTDGTTRLAYNDDGGEGLASRLEWTAPADGTYFVRIRHAFNSYGTNTHYDVSVSSTGASGLADRYEDDDTPESAGVIIVNGDAQSHNFHDAGDQDWIRFEARLGVDYTIETFNLGLNSDTILALYDADAALLLDLNDDSGGTLASRINWVAPANGVYYINISSNFSGSFSDETDYDVRVTGLDNSGPDEFEDDDAAAQARPLNLGQTQTHNFHEAGDQDWIQFSAGAGQAYILETLNLGSRSDTVLELYDTDGATLLGSDDDGGTAVASRLEWAAPADGVYYAKVRHFFNGTFGANTHYDLRLSGGEFLDAFEPDDTVDLATLIFPDENSQIHNFHASGDVDWIVFFAESNETYFIETANLGPASDTVLTLYDTDGATLLEKNDDGGSGLASRIIWTASGAGNYYLKVNHYNPQAGGLDTNYDLNVTTSGFGGDDFEPDNTGAQATSIAGDGSAQTHNFHIGGDQDWVSFTATAGTAYIIKTFNLGPESDTYLTLYDIDGVTPLVRDDDGGDEPLASRIEWTAPAGGVYFVQLRHYRSSVFGPQVAYDLAVTGLNNNNNSDAYEADDAYTQATLMTANGDRQTHNFHIANDQDWVQFEAVAGVAYFIETINLGAQSDTVLELYGPDGATLLAYDDDGGDDGLASRIEWTAPADDTYFIKVSRFDNAVFGPETTYTLRIIDNISRPDLYEPDNSQAEAKDISTNSSGAFQTHNAHVAGDVDWVKFVGGADETCTIQTLNLGPQSDTFLEFYDADLNLLASDDDSGQGGASRLVVQIPEGNVTYYVKVRQYFHAVSGSATIYDLTIACAEAGEPDALAGGNSVTMNKTGQPAVETPAATVALTVPAAQLGDEVEAMVYLREVVSAVKVAAYAKSTYLNLTEATLIDPHGKTLGEQLTAAAGWQQDTTDTGRITIGYAGKLDGAGDRSGPVLRLRWRLTTPLPAAELAIPFQLTTVDYKGQAASHPLTLLVGLQSNAPKIYDVSPKSLTNDVETVVSIQGANFKDTPKVYLLTGNQEIQLTDVEIVDPDPGAPFIQAVVPAGVKPGLYKVRLVNPDEHGAEYAAVEVTAVTKLSLDNTAFLPVILK